MGRPTLLALLVGLLGSIAVADTYTRRTCEAPNKWECTLGCHDSISGSCSSANESVCQAGGSIEWKKSCNCKCQVCDFGCYDREGKGCLANTNKMQCAEIYGHVEWSQVCNCRHSDGSSVAANNLGGNGNTFFSIPAFVVLFCESLEVVIVLVVIMQFLHQARDDRMISPQEFTKLRCEAYMGAGIGFLICIAIGVVSLRLAHVFRMLFKGDNSLIFDGIMTTIACLVLSFLALNCYKMLLTKEAHEQEVKALLEKTMQQDSAAEAQGVGSTPLSKKHSFLILAFTMGMREGLKSIIFLLAVSVDVDEFISLPLPIVTALVLARVCGCLFFQGTKKTHVEWFLRFFAFVILLVAAGFFSSSIQKWEELNAFGARSPKEERPWPTPLVFFACTLYWIVAIFVGFFLVCRAERERVENRSNETHEAEGEARKADATVVAMVSVGRVF